MKLLVLGTSHAGAIRMAELAGHADPFHEISYCAIAHGTGPNFTLGDDLRLSPTSAAGERTRQFLPTNILEIKLDEFDAILVSALECYALTLRPMSLRPHCGALYRLGAKEGVPLISEPLFRAQLHNNFLQFDGTKLVRQVCERIRVPVFVQTAPLPSEAATSMSDWTLAQLYKNPTAALHYFASFGRSEVNAFCQEIGATWIDIPNPEWIAASLTPIEFMDRDMAHGNAKYGALVLDQLIEHMRSSRDSTPLLQV